MGGGILKSVYGWLVISVTILLSVMSIVSGISLLKTVGILERGEGVGNVEGRVVNADGEPIFNAYVWFEKFPGVRTNESGYFKLEGISAGVRVINFWSIGYKRKSLRVTVYPSWMRSRWGELNDIGEIPLEKSLSVVEGVLPNVSLNIHVNDIPGPPSNFTYTVYSPRVVEYRGTLQDDISLDPLPVGTYLFAVNGSGGVWEYVFYLSPEKSFLNITMNPSPGRYDLRSTSTITLILPKDKVGDWVDTRITSNFGENYSGIRNVTDAVVITVVEGVYNVTIGSPYSGTVLYTNVSTPSTISWNATFSEITVKPKSLELVKLLAFIYISIGIFGFVGAFLISMRRRFRTALASLVLLMFSPSPTAFICSLSVLLGLLAIFMLYRIREEFDRRTTSSEGERTTPLQQE